MEIVYVNKTENSSWDSFYADFENISGIASTKLSINDESELSVILVDDKTIQDINRDYRSIDAVTDVITFALQDELTEIETQFKEIEMSLGDIFICVDAVERQAKEYGHSLKREICFLFTHGLLHLLGYNHMNEEDEKSMFALQDEILEGFVPRV